MLRGLSGILPLLGLILLPTLQAQGGADPSGTLIITQPETGPIGNYPGRNVVISPDGRHLVYAVGSLGTGGQLFLRNLDEQTSAPIPGTQGLWYSPFFSPDSRFIAFVTNGRQQKIRLPAGSPSILFEVTGQWGGSWGPADTIVFATDGGIFRVPAAGGDPKNLIVPDPDEDEVQYRMPELLPDGETVLFTILGRGTSRIALLSLASGEKRILVAAGKEARYAPTGHLVYEAPGMQTLMGWAFDLKTRQVQGRPVAVLEGIRARQEGAVDFSFSRNGTLAYIPARSSTDSTLVWVDREGRSTPLTGMRRPFSAPRLAPDGERVAITLGDTTRGDIWMYRGGDLIRLTSGGSNTFPVWTPDGQRLSFASNRAGPWNIFWTPADGSGESEPLFPGPENQIPGSWSPHGVLAYTRGKGVGRDIWVFPLNGDRQPREFFATPFIERNPMFSPDGKWIALVSLRTGRAEIYVKPYPGPGEAVQISTDGGNEPRWSPDGRELFYRNGKRMMTVVIQTEPALSPASPRPLFEADYAQNHVGSLSNYDVDGQGRFLMVLEEEPSGGQIKVIFNWFEQLKRLVPNR